MPAGTTFATFCRVGERDGEGRERELRTTISAASWKGDEVPVRNYQRPTRGTSRSSLVTGPPRLLPCLLLEPTSAAGSSGRRPWPRPAGKQRRRLDCSPFARAIVLRGISENTPASAEDRQCPGKFPPRNVKRGDKKTQGSARQGPWTVAWRHLDVELQQVTVLAVFHHELGEPLVAARATTHKAISSFTVHRRYYTESQVLLSMVLPLVVSQYTFL